MKQLIEALTIFLKYQDRLYPTHCGYDELHIVGITCEEISSEDKKRLDGLGFFWSDDDERWMSFRYGSA